MNNIRLLICGALFCISGWAQSAEFTAKVIAVLDGDTVLVRRASGLVKIRLAEIDAPEKAQIFGEASKQSLSGMVLGKQVKVVSQAVDQYGRLVAHLSVDGLEVNAEQIRRGMAWEYSNFHSNKILITMQNEAQQAPRGLWAQNNPTPPWEWRKLHPSIKPDGDAAAATDHSATPNTNCGNKKHCTEMSSCEEAKFYLTQCGVKSLDGDGDGLPCEELCAPSQKSKNWQKSKN